MIEIKHSSSPDTIKDICKIGIQNKIYHKSGMLLSSYKDCEDIISIAYCLYYNCVIGIAIESNDMYNIQLYVKYKHRKKGIGKELVHSILKNGSREQYKISVDRSNQRFWNSIDDSRLVF